MGDRKGDLCFLIIGVLYTVISFFIYLQCGGYMGPLAWDIKIVPIMGMVATAAAFAVVAGFCNSKYHWWSALLFGVWTIGVMVVQICIYVVAISAV